MRTSLAVAFVLLSSLAPAQTARSHAWWNDTAPGARPYSADAKKMPLLAVRGNRIVDPQGQSVLVRGFAISDPDKIAQQGHWNREHFVKAKELGARLLRIPVHPIAWRERGPAEYLKLLDQAVEWCTALDMYIMLDWHSIGNLETGVFQDPMYDTTLQETYNFWRTIARHYPDHNTIAFYELFNEPTTFNDRLGPASWDEWKKINETLITIIRAHNRQAIPLVAGFDWAYDLTPIRISPVNAEGVAYATHPYSNKTTQPWEPKWEKDFGFAAGSYPVLATEFGGFDPKEPFALVTPAQQGEYGPAILKYLEGRGIGWVVWCFDPDWGPTLIKDWEYALTPSGEFIKKALAR